MNQFGLLCGIFLFFTNNFPFKYFIYSSFDSVINNWLYILIIYKQKLTSGYEIIHLRLIKLIHMKRTKFLKIVKEIILAI